MRTHFSVTPPSSIVAVSSCGVGKRLNTNVYTVDCLKCRGREDFHKAWQAAEDAKQAEFLAQTPRQFAEPWRDGIMRCDKCHGTLFREAARTCYGHYANHECAHCGHVESRLTETGMSF